jgi:hypothetical protein
MRHAVFGALMGDNRLLRSFDSLGWNTWGWTAVLGADVAGVREVAATIGENIVALCDLIGGGQAIFHSHNSGDTWSKVLEADEIYDITSVGFNWTLASTSDGWYSSLKAGSSWVLIAEDGVGVPVGLSVVWTTPNYLFTHTGDAIWRSDEKGAAGSWEKVYDLTTNPGYSANAKFIA